MNFTRRIFNKIVASSVLIPSFIYGKTAQRNDTLNLTKLRELGGCYANNFDIQLVSSLDLEKCTVSGKTYPGYKKRYTLPPYPYGLVNNDIIVIPFQKYESEKDIFSYIRHFFITQKWPERATLYLSNIRNVKYYGLLAEFNS